MLSTDEQALAQGQGTIDEVVELALRCPAGGNSSWDELLARLGCSALPTHERIRQLRDGPGQSRGALLLELRAALDAATEPMRARMEDPYRLSARVDAAMRAYVSATRPVVTTSSIFANALADSAHSPARMSGDASSQADCCSCCGAPRTVKAGPTCPYCGEAR